jgi:hypothetical protein
VCAQLLQTSAEIPATTLTGPRKEARAQRMAAYKRAHARAPAPAPAPAMTMDAAEVRFRFLVLVLHVFTHALMRGMLRCADSPGRAALNAGLKRGAGRTAL